MNGKLINYTPQQVVQLQASQVVAAGQDIEIRRNMFVWAVFDFGGNNNPNFVFAELNIEGGEPIQGVKIEHNSTANQPFI
jgi:hypothetical protein